MSKKNKSQGIDTTKPEGSVTPEAEFPEERSQGTSTTRGYTVEARTTGGIPPQIVEGKAIDNQWRQLDFSTSATIGVPAHSRWDHGLAAAHLYTEEAAEALRWWWLAERGMTGRIFFETRLVEHSVTFSYTCTAIGEKSIVTR